MKLAAGRTSFMKMMILDYAEQLEVPPAFLKPAERSEDVKFVKPMGVLSEGEYQLRVCGSGGRHCWIVEAEKENGSLFFRKGWVEFLEDNNVRFADVLVFKYQGWNKFLVTLFEPSGVKRNVDLRENDIVVEASNGGNGEGEDEPMSMDMNEDDGQGDGKPFSIDLDESLIYFVNGDGECHMEVEGRRENGKLGSVEPAKDSLDCLEVGEEKEKEIHDYAAALQKGYQELNFSATKGATELDAAGQSQKESLPRFEERKKRHDFAAQKQKESLDSDTSAMKGESEQGTGGQTKQELLSRFDVERDEHVFAAPIQRESLGLDSSARKGESKEGIGGQSRKESSSPVKDGKERVTKSSVLPPFSSSNTHFTATWEPTWQHCLTIPKEIAVEKDLHSKSQLVFRDLKGRIWFMKLSTGEDGAINLTNDWLKFYRNFGLKEGDSCTFEFFSSRIVHIHVSSTRSESHTGQ